LFFFTLFLYSYKNQSDCSQGCFGNGLDELNLNPKLHWWYWRNRYPNH